MRGVIRILFVGFLALAIARGAPLPVFAAENSSAENLSFSVGPTTYRIKRIDAEGAVLTAADLARIFDAKELTPLKERFARLSATRIVIPEIAGETAAASAKQEFVYRDVTLENVVAGRIGRLRAASLEQAIDRPQGGRVNARYGPISAENIDLAQIAHVFAEARADDKEPLKSIQDAAVVENAVLTVPEAQLELRVARLVAKGVKARAASRPLSRWFDVAATMGPTPTDEQSAALALTAMEAIGGFEIELIEAQDVSASAAGTKPFTLKIGRATLAKAVDAVLGEVSIDDLSYAGADSSKVALRHVALRGLELRPLFEQNERRFPRVAHMELAGLDANLPDASVSESAREKFRIASGVADLSAYRDGAPTRVSARMDHSIIDLTERGGAPADAQLIALGYKEVDLSWAFDGEWREKEQELLIQQAMLEGTDMGRVNLTATLANVSPLVFSPNAVLSRAAALSVLVKRVDATFENMRLVDKAIELEAKSKGVDPAKLRADYAVSAEALILSFFEGNEKVRQAAEAIGKFVASPKHLNLRLQSANGVGSFDALTSRPSEILRSVDIEAKAAQ
jgi:hypothetical protein